MDAKDRPKALTEIGLMLGGFPSSQQGISEVTVQSYLKAVSDCSLVSIQAACSAFLKGQVSEHKNDYPPTAPRLASLCAALDEAADRLANGTGLISYKIGEPCPDGYVPLGPKDDRWAGKSRIRRIEQTKPPIGG